MSKGFLVVLVVVLAVVVLFAGIAIGRRSSSPHSPILSSKPSLAVAEETVKEGQVLLAAPVIEQEQDLPPEHAGEAMEGFDDTNAEKLRQLWVMLGIGEMPCYTDEWMELAPNAWFSINWKVGNDGQEPISGLKVSINVDPRIKGRSHFQQPTCETELRENQRLAEIGLALLSPEGLEVPTILPGEPDPLLGHTNTRSGEVEVMLDDVTSGDVLEYSMTLKLGTATLNFPTHKITVK